MRVDYLIHQTKIEYLTSILTHGLKFSLKSNMLVELGHLERFIWFDFIGRMRDEIVYSDVGGRTAKSLGVTIVLDFDKILTKVRQQDGFSLKFLSEFVRFHPVTKNITLWDSTVDSEYHMDKASRSIECVISTDAIDKTLNKYLHTKSDRDEIRFNITDCISKFVVCPADEITLNTILRMFGLGGRIPVVVHRGLSEDEMRSIIQTHCPGHSAELCEMLHIEAFISNCVKLDYDQSIPATTEPPTVFRQESTDDALYTRLAENHDYDRLLQIYNSKSSILGSKFLDRYLSSGDAVRLIAKKLHESYQNGENINMDLLALCYDHINELDRGLSAFIYDLAERYA